MPPGLDPGGIAIALLGTGVDYTRREIAGRLARDGEGDLIAWDFTDNDTKPYAASSPNTADAAYLANNTTSTSLVVVKEATDSPVAIGHMAAFTIRTPARVIVWPDGSPQRPDWPVLFEAADRFKDRLFVVPAPPKTTADQRKYDNVVLVAATAGSDIRTAVLDAAARAASLLLGKTTLSARELKIELLKN